MPSINIDKFISSVEKKLNDLPRKVLPILEGEVIVLKQKINSRVVERGIDGSGSKFKEYTAGYLRFKEDVGRYRGHVDISLGNYSINKRIAAVEKRKKERINKMKKAGKESKQKARSKNEIEELKSKRRANYSAKGATLWRSIDLVGEKKQVEGKIVATVAPKDDLNRKKLQGLVKHRDVLSVSSDEAKSARDNIQIEIVEVIKKIFS